MADNAQNSDPANGEISLFNPDGTPKTEAQLKKEAKKREKNAKFLAKQAKLEEKKAQTSEVCLIFVNKGVFFTPRKSSLLILLCLH